MIRDRLNHYRYLIERHRNERRKLAHFRRAMSTDAQHFTSGAQLPAGYGKGLSERAIEFGWAMAQGMGGDVLDAGSTFNHPYTLDALLPRASSLRVFTLAPEPVNFPERGVIYEYGDLRAMPYVDASFDFVASLSVVEHIGMDNRDYGAEDDRDGSAGNGSAAAVTEMVRVLRPGGTLLVTVPYGRAHNHGWFRVLDADGVEQLRSATSDPSASVTVYGDTDNGWRLSTMEAEADATYGEWKAGAVACLKAVKR